MPPKAKGTAQVLGNDLSVFQVLPGDAAAPSSIHSLDRASGLMPGRLSCPHLVVSG